jgi:hypothetical protein|tara:strand:+ start:1334 stop:1501 length:168 start_codon:yes stop_codon:yes gene_type:complete
MEKEIIWEIGSFGLVFSKNIPMSVDNDEDDDREEPKQLPESCPPRASIRIKVKNS